ncbi:hypothetical protein, partial [Burkholderia territorii]|uniref:hypothetical protein n=1 Tax=Burkholderia territorii TaxID=1503055 RepID=UPI001E59964B
NRTVKRLYADDSADSRVKVGNRQAPLKPETPARQGGGFCIFSVKIGKRTATALALRHHDYSIEATPVSAARAPALQFNAPPAPH